MNEEKRIPRHVAIIMDGDGRWAQQHGKERCYGHMQGVEPVRSAIRAAVRNGVEVLTLYAFSTENWGRPREEVEALMELLCRSVVNETPELRRQGVRIRAIGERSAFSSEVRDRRTDRGRSALHRPVARPRPGHPHQRRVPVEQFPAVAGRLCGALFHAGALARLHGGGVRPCARSVRRTGEAFWFDK